MKQIFALKPSGLCIAVQKHCKGSYNSKHIYKVDCNSISCEGLGQKYKCGNKHCAMDKEKCEKFLVYENLLGKIIATDNKKKGFRNSTYLNKFIGFMKAIKKCAKIPYTFKPEDVCLNGKDCATKQIIKMRSGDIKMLKVILI